MTRRIKAALPHHERGLEELRADHELAVECCKAAMESPGDPEDRVAGHLSLRTVAEACGGPDAAGRHRRPFHAVLPARHKLKAKDTRKLLAKGSFRK